MSDIDSGTPADPTGRVEAPRNVELIDVQSTVRRYLRFLVDDPALQAITSSYVPLRLAPFRPSEATPEEGDQGAHSQSNGGLESTSDILPSMEDWQRIILLGAAGSGKTATLRWLARQQAEDLLVEGNWRSQDGTGAAQYVPLYVELWECTGADGLLGAIGRAFEEYDLPAHQEAVSHILDRYPILFLLDGLESVHDNDLLVELARLVESGDSRCVVSCCAEAYIAFRRWLEDPQVFELEDLSDEGRRIYIETQLPESARPFAVSRARGEKRLWNLLRIPLFSTTFVELAEKAPGGLGWVPTSAVVQQGVQRLLEAATYRSEELEVDSAERGLAALALQMQHLGSSEAVELDRGQAMVQLASVGAPVSPQWLSRLASTGIITIAKTNDTISFADPMLQDFFAAQAVSESYSGALSKSICLDSEETAQQWGGVLLHLYHFLTDRLAYLQQLLRTRIDGWGPRIAAECLVYNEESQEARELAASLALVDTLDLTSVYQLGVALKSMGKKDDANALFEGMLGRERDPSHPRQEMLGYRQKYGGNGSETPWPEQPEKLISLRNLGLLYRELDQVDRAVSELEQAVQGANVACSDTYHELGQAYLQQGRLEDALASFQHAIALSPGVAAYHHGVGAVLNRLHRYVEAQAELQQATMLDPDDAGPYLELGYAYEQQGWHGEAMAAYEAAEARNPREASCPHRISKLLSLQGRWDEAIQAIQRALALEPNRAEWHYDLGTLYERLGQGRIALAAFEDAAHLDPQNPEYLHRTGTLSREMNHPTKAIDYLQAAVELDSEQASWFFELASAMASEGRYDEAWVWSDRSIALDPKDAQYRALAGRILRNLRRHSEAESHLREALQLDSQQAAAHELALLLESDGRTDEALAEYEAAVAIEPEHATYHYHLGALLRRVGQLDSAASSLSRAIELHPSLADALAELGAVYEETERDADALLLYDQAISIDPGNAGHYLRAGALSHKLGRAQEARDYLEEALRLGAQSGEVHFLRGQVNEAGGLLERALEEYQEAIGVSPEEPEYHVRAAAVSYRLGRVNEARAEAEKALELNHGSPEVNYELGRVLHEMGLSKEAAVCFERAAEVAPDKPELRLVYARALRDLGRVEEAIQALEAAQQSLREPAPIHAELAEVYSEGNASARSRPS
jgi:tetratricopeptide (TPR) repeat protein